MAAAIGTLAGSCFSGFAGFYCQLLLLVFFLLLICLIQLLRQNLFAWFPMICGLNVLLASLATGTAFAQGLAAAGAGILICRFTQSDWMWIDTEFKLSMMMLGNSRKQSDLSDDADLSIGRRMDGLSAGDGVSGHDDAGARNTWRCVWACCSVFPSAAIRLSGARRCY